MRLIVKQPVLDYEGKPLLTNKTKPDGSIEVGEDGRPIQVPETLRAYLVAALNDKASTETEPIGAEEAAKRYQLSTKLYAKNDVELTQPECALLQERITKRFEYPLVQGRIIDMLEGRKISVPADEPDDKPEPAVADLEGK